MVKIIVIQYAMVTLVVDLITRHELSTRKEVVAYVTINQTFFYSPSQGIRDRLSWPVQPVYMVSFLYTPCLHLHIRLWKPMTKNVEKGYVSVSGSGLGFLHLEPYRNLIWQIENPVVSLKNLM